MWNSLYAKHLKARISEEHQNVLSKGTPDSLFQAYPVYLAMMVSSPGQESQKAVS